MDRREFLRCASAAGAASAAGCISQTGGEAGLDEGGSDSLPGHGRWLFDTGQVEFTEVDGWFGYVLTRPEGVDEAHPWSEAYTEFGIEMNLKHYGLADYMMMEEQYMDYSSVDVTRYSEDVDLFVDSGETRVDHADLRPTIRLERPASTGGPLREQEVVETVDGFDFYERYAAVNEEERVVISSPQEYVRSDVAPAIVESDVDDLPQWLRRELEVIWNTMDAGHYNEVGVNPTELATYSGAYELSAFARSENIRGEDEVEVTQVEVFPEEDAVETDEALGRMDVGEADVEVEGRAVVYRAVAEDLITAFDF